MNYCNLPATTEIPTDEYLPAVDLVYEEGLDPPNWVRCVSVVPEKDMRRAIMDERVELLEQYLSASMGSHDYMLEYGIEIAASQNAVSVIDWLYRTRRYMLYQSGTVGHPDHWRNSMLIAVMQSGKRARPAMLVWDFLVSHSSAAVVEYVCKTFLPMAVEYEFMPLVDLCADDPATHETIVSTAAAMGSYGVLLAMSRRSELDNVVLRIVRNEKVEATEDNLDLIIRYGSTAGFIEAATKTSPWILKDPAALVNHIFNCGAEDILMWYLRYKTAGAPTPAPIPGLVLVANRQWRHFTDKHGRMLLSLYKTGNTKVITHAMMVLAIESGLPIQTLTAMRNKLNEPAYYPGDSAIAAPPMPVATFNAILWAMRQGLYPMLYPRWFRALAASADNFSMVLLLHANRRLTMPDIVEDMLSRVISSADVAICEWLRQNGYILWANSIPFAYTNLRLNTIRWLVNNYGLPSGSKIARPVDYSVHSLSYRYLVKKITEANSGGGSDASAGGASADIISS